MSSMLDRKNYGQDVKKSKYGFIVLLIFFMWLLFPAGNRFMQLSYWADNLVYTVGKATKISKLPEYGHYRNKAIYLAKIYPKDSTKALNEMNKALAAVPKDAEPIVISSLYCDRAVIKLYYGDKKGALDDYMLAEETNIYDDLRIAILLADEGQYDEATSYCEGIISKNFESLYGYVCLAYIKEKQGNIENAVKMYDWALEVKENSERAYLERAKLKRKLNDDKGADSDLQEAKRISPYSDPNSSVIDDAVNFKKLPLSIN